MKTDIHATELNSLLDKYPQIKVLSLDCFDTIFWRKTATPADVFFHLQNQPVFKSHGYSASLRTQAEMRARQMKKLETGSSEVGLEEIYQSLDPDLATEQITQLIEEEIQSEIELSYLFTPIIELITQARDRKLPVILVSDTYFDNSQILRLLQSKWPEAATMIDRVFCSSDWQKCKANGLFSIVLSELNADPQSILHIGDHPLADVRAASEAGIQALRLFHHNADTLELLRMRAWSALMMDPSIRYTRPLYNPFHAVLAATELEADNPASMIGYASLGPLLYTFAAFIQQTVKRLQHKGKRPRVVFLMRDAYLPMLACEAMIGAEAGTPISISRFSAYAASFRSQRDINRYVISVAGSLRFSDACAQLLLPEEYTQQIIAKVNATEHPAAAFIKLMQNEFLQRIIIEQSSLYCQRLLKYIHKHVPIERGDTLLFVDLGYTGTAQNKLAPILKQELGVEIFGCYMLSLNQARWRDSRCGLFDPSWCDERQLQTLVEYIALLEQLCTSTDNSVIDFDEMGLPVASATGNSNHQHTRLRMIQKECIRFIKNASVFLSQTGVDFPVEILRDAAMADLARLIFLPSRLELDFLQSFTFDLNLGTKDLLPMFNEQAGLQGLRKRGLLFMEKNLRSMRTNYPAELRSAGMELSFTLMASHRYGIYPRLKDMSFRSEKITVVAARADDEVNAELEAIPTHDGYYSLIVPLCDGNCQAKVLFGKKYRWVQIDSVEYIAESALFGQRESQYSQDAWQDTTLKQMSRVDTKLFECLSPSGTLTITPPELIANNHIARITFRPLVPSH